MPRLFFVLLLLSTGDGVLTAAPVWAAPVLRAADITITITSPASCDVTMTLTAEGTEQIEHRIEAFPAGAGPASDGAPPGVQLLDVSGATPIGEIRRVGQTRALVLRPDRTPYSFRYRAVQPAGRRDRCPLWLPAIPSDGQSRSIRLRVTLPADALPGSTMPAFAWTGREGAATMANVPAFVRVPYTLPGDPRPWDLGAVVDGTAVFLFVAVSAIWMWRRRR